MAATYWQRGESIDRVNSGTETIDAGTIQVIGKRIGVVGGQALPGQTYSVHVEGVFAFPKKAAEAITAGAEVYYDGTEITATSAEGSTLAGFAIEDAAENDSTVLVKINA